MTLGGDQLKECPLFFKRGNGVFETSLLCLRGRERRRYLGDVCLHQRRLLHRELRRLFQELILFIRQLTGTVIDACPLLADKRNSRREAVGQLLRTCGVPVLEVGDKLI